MTICYYRFKTDSSVNAKGFSIYYTMVNSPTTTTGNEVGSGADINLDINLDINCM